jgi:hypothetical protein
MSPDRQGCTHENHPGAEDHPIGTMPIAAPTDTLAGMTADGLVER